MKSPLDLNLIPILEALVIQESVSGAARQLDITQSAVSHALRRLREHFQDTLFVRSGNRMLPTPFIQTIEPFIRSTMDGVRGQLSRAVAFDPESARHSFTISTTDVGELIFIPKIIRRIRIQSPASSIRTVSVSSAGLHDALANGEIDVYLGVQKPESESLYQQTIYEQRLVCVASKSYYEDLSAFETAETFCDLPHVAICPYRPDQDAYEWAFKRHGLRRRVVCAIRTGLAVPFLVSESDLIATVPDYIAASFKGHADLMTLPLPIPVPKISIWQVWHERFQNDAANVWLRHLINMAVKS
ncbi:MAG TPA: LysR family transcriptional regulator [Sphingobium sp.]|nr:LysR family transcriptional regulator [Sphingobium sp.]